MGISKKILALVGGSSVQKWAEMHGLPKQTVHEWIKNDRLPMGANFDRLINATGLSKDWWIDEKSDIPYDLKIGNHYIELKTKQNVKEYKNTDSLYIESYPEVRGAAGSGQLTPTDQVVINIAVNAADWRNYVGLDHKHIKVIAVHGDSMKPTLSHGDQVLVDTACHRFVDDAIYAIQQGDLTRFKRIKLRLDGSIEVKSDNDKEGFKLEIYNATEAAEFKLIGRVIPFKFGRFDL